MLSPVIVAWIDLPGKEVVLGGRTCNVVGTIVGTHRSTNGSRDLNPYTFRHRFIFVSTVIIVIGSMVSTTMAEEKEKKKCLTYQDLVNATGGGEI